MNQRGEAARSPLPPGPTPAQCAFLRGDAARAPPERAPSGLPSPWRHSKTHTPTPWKPDFFFFLFLRKRKQKKKSYKELSAARVFHIPSPDPSPQSDFWSRRAQLKRSAGSPPAPPPRQPRPGRTQVLSGPGASTAPPERG
ncbi:unnamed protein product [Rangifer tarandus platyrhynchus]|uniref:Uncharacterized protein n=1 Tax=Rangifer tarandus platyrhynchus TaxID=3082113 RepID=A0ABN8Y029_RANTA|nr:unnamed protein product [Rangifer tarandus platyrhynchus]